MRSDKGMRRLSCALVWMLLVVGALGGCADDEAPWQSCHAISKALSGDMGLDLHGAWLGKDSLRGAMLLLRPEGTWAFREVDGPWERGSYSIHGGALRLCKDETSRADWIEVSESSLRVLVGGEAEVLSFERVVCDGQEVEQSVVSRSAERHPRCTSPLTSSGV